LYPINLPVLQQFFDQAVLAKMHGNTSFRRLPVIVILKFRIFQSNFSEHLANDKLAHLSLKRMAQHAKDDTMIYQSSIDPILARKWIPFESTCIPNLICYPSLQYLFP
jgi:hypothetical protein